MRNPSVATIQRLAKELSAHKDSWDAIFDEVEKQTGMVIDFHKKVAQ